MANPGKWKGGCQSIEREKNWVTYARCNIKLGELTHSQPGEVRPILDLRRTAANSQLASLGYGLTWNMYTFLAVDRYIKTTGIQSLNQTNSYKNC